MKLSKNRLGLGIGAAVIAVGLGTGIYAAAQENTAPAPQAFSGRHGGGFGGFRMLASRLGLSDAQKDQIKTILQSHRDEWKGLADRSRTARQALSAAVSADTIDEAAIRQRSADLAAVQADIAVARAHTRGEVFQVLTPDQQAQAKALWAQTRQRRQK